MQQWLRIIVMCVGSLLICDSNSRTGSNFLPTVTLGEAKRLLLTRIVCYRDDAEGKGFEGGDIPRADIQIYWQTSRVGAETIRAERDRSTLY
jgi:hypothetical protein